MIADYRGKAVLVTGGTAGIGLATALAFGRQGAECTLTYRFGTADEDEVRARFAAVGAPSPHIVQADAARDEDTDALLDQMRGRHARIEVFISNVSAALVVNDLEDYTLRGLEKSVALSAWPTFRYTQKIKALFGRYPRYLVAMSSTGPDHYAKSYDYVAASKAVLETLCRYLSYRLYDEDIRINVLRSRSVRTDSLRATFGAEFQDFAQRFTTERHFIEPDEVGQAALALCSGLLDGFRGQVLTVDRGTSFFDNLMRLYNERGSLEL